MIRDTRDKRVTFGNSGVIFASIGEPMPEPYRKLAHL